MAGNDVLIDDLADHQMQRSVGQQPTQIWVVYCAQTYCDPLFLLLGRHHHSRVVHDCRPGVHADRAGRNVSEPVAPAQTHDHRGELAGDERTRRVRGNPRCIT